MPKEFIIRGQVKFKEITLTESLTNRILSIGTDGSLTDRPAIDVSAYMTTALATNRINVGNGGGAAAAVNTNSVGDILADSTNGLTIKAGAIVNADVNAAAAIAYSKLNLAGLVVNTDIGAAAAIAYSKLNLTGLVVNADIAAAAGIGRSKLASGTAYRILANTSLGVMSENAALGASLAIASDANGQLVGSAATAAQLGYSATLTGDIQTQLDNEIATKTVAAIVKAPTVAENGFAITWDNGTGKYTLTDPVVQGIPVGGSSRQWLGKNTGSDYDAGWLSLVLTDVTDVTALIADVNVLAGANAAGLTPTKVGYLVGITSPLQIQLDSKQSSNLAQNAIWVGNGSGLAAALAGGTNGYVLTSVSGVPTWQPVSSGTPAGATTQVIFNDAGAYAGDASLTWDKTNNALSIGTMRMFTVDLTYDDVFIGKNAGNFTTTGTGGNIGIGEDALVTITTSENNIALGAFAGKNHTTGLSNIFLGLSAGGHLTGGPYTGWADNIGIGRQALSLLGNNAGTNIGIGLSAGSLITIGTDNIAIGSQADVPTAAGAGQLSIQNIIYGTGNTNGGLTVSTGNIGIGQPAPSAKLHITEDTLGAAVLKYSSPATNDDPTVTIYQNRITTTDATPTTLHTIAIPATTTVCIQMTVVARRTGGASGTAEDGGSLWRVSTFKNVAGTATIVDTSDQISAQFDQAAWTVTLTPSAGNVNVVVTGATGNNVTWHLAELKVMQVSS